MAILAYDDVMLREPRLLVPNATPLGPVKINWAHPSANGMTSAMLCLPGTGFRPVDLVTGETYTVATGTLPAPTWLKAKMAAWDFAGITVFVPYTKHYILQGTNGTVVILGDNMVSRDAVRQVLAGNVAFGNDDDGSGRYSLFDFSLGTGSLPVAFGFFYQVFGGYKNIGITKGGKINKDETPYYVYHAHLDGPFINQASYDVTTSWDVVIGTADSATSRDGGLFCQENGTGNYTYSCESTFGGIMCWNRTLGEGELASILMNPYQVLVPA